MGGPTGQDVTGTTRSAKNAQVRHTFRGEWACDQRQRDRTQRARPRTVCKFLDKEPVRFICLDCAGERGSGSEALATATLVGRPTRMSTLSRLSLDEKAELTAGADIWHTAAVERLGIPALRLTDGPSGARGTRFSGNTSTSLPCGTALAATWDRDLVHRVGGLLADEARGKGAHVLLAPTVNLHRHPLDGRHFECFSEDPYLSAELAVAYIEGVQGRGVGCVGQALRGQRPGTRPHGDQRRGRRAHAARDLPAAVRGRGEQRRRLWSAMAAYNRLHGIALQRAQRPARRRSCATSWGFDGLVMSDWFGTHSTIDGHRRARPRDAGPGPVPWPLPRRGGAPGRHRRGATGSRVENLLGLVDRVAGRGAARAPGRRGTFGTGHAHSGKRSHRGAAAGTTDPAAHRARRKRSRCSGPRPTVLTSRAAAALTSTRRTPSRHWRRSRNGFDVTSVMPCK